MDLARSIMLHIEEHDNVDFVLPEYDKHAVGYHVRLLKEAGLINAVALTAMDGNIILQNNACTALTWEGHEFLDAARDNTRWNRAKKAITEKIGTASLEVLSKYLTKIMNEGLGL